MLRVNTSKRTLYSNLYRGNCVSKSSYDRRNVLECILALSRARGRARTHYQIVRVKQCYFTPAEKFHVLLHTLQPSQRTKDSLEFFRKLRHVWSCHYHQPKVPNVYRNPPSIWNASYRMDNTDSYQFCSLFTCWTFVSVPFVTLPVAINITSHREHLPYCQTAMILAPDRTSFMYNIGFRCLAAACVWVTSNVSAYIPAAVRGAN